MVSSPLLQHVEPHLQGKDPAHVPPATLPGTPSSFPIGHKKLVELAKALFEAESGVENPTLLAEGFRFEFPVVSLARADFLKAVSGFKLKKAFPNMDAHAYDWRVDPYEPQRVWFTVRNTGTHTGALTLPWRTIQPTGKVVLGAPECLSYTFDEQGKCTSFTGGYIMDRRVGNTKKLGALFGILAALGQPVPGSGSSILSAAGSAALHAVAFAHSVLEYGYNTVFGPKKAA